MFRRVLLPQEAQVQGSLLLHSMPGRYEAWIDFRRQAAEEKVDLIACLAPLDEIEVKSPSYAQAIKNNELPCARREHPIKDFGIPDNQTEFAKFISSIAEQLQTGTTVLMHCAGGIGRTGTAATCVLHALGFDRDKASELIEAAGSRPETPEQRQLVVWHYKEKLI